jgi:hypothetical protein
LIFGRIARLPEAFVYQGRNSGDRTTANTYHRNVRVVTRRIRAMGQKNVASWAKKSALLGF